MKSFDSKNYKKLLLCEGISTIFRLISEAGFVDKIIEVYPKLNSSRDSYLKVADNMINFPESKTLLQSNIRK